MLSRQDNITIELLFVTAILIFLNLGAVSISFPIGIYALIRFHKRISSSFWSKNICWLTGLFFIGIVSCLLSPVPFTFKTLYFLIQLGYWLYLARMIGELYPFLDLHRLSRCIGRSCIVLGGAYILLGLGTQNSVAFILVILGPLGIYGFGSVWKLYYALAISIMMFFNDSRSGLAILIVEMFFISTIYISKKKVKNLLFLSILTIAIFICTPNLRSFVGNMIQPYNREMALLLTNPEIVQTRDKSWIQREIQVQKGIQIYKEHPIIGVGPNNFTPMDIDIDYSNLRNRIDENVLNAVTRSADNRSTHNSYISILSEFGALGMISWILFIGSVLILMYKKIHALTPFEFGLFVCALGMSIYFYTIAALYGTAAWLFYGMLYGFYRKYKIA